MYYRDSHCYGYWANHVKYYNILILQASGLQQHYASRPTKIDTIKLAFLLRHNAKFCVIKNSCS